MPGRRVLATLAAAAIAVPVAAAVHGCTAATNRAAAPALASAPTSSADMTGRVIYQLVTDRFYDGDPSNDNPSSSPNLNSADHSNWILYWGGDFAGVTAKMQYLKDLGVGAIWISPPVQNVDVPVPVNGVNQAGYHGYWAMDYYVPEPHFGSWAAFDTMVSTAHADGIKVIMDWAANHTSPEDVSNAAYAKDGALYQNGTKLSEYDADPNGWFHHNGGGSDDEDLYQAQYENLFNLADLNQENASVDAYLKGALDTWLGHGVDGIRMDTVKHMTTGWLTNYDDHVYAQHSVFTFGEWADTSDAYLFPNEAKFANTVGQSVQSFNLNNAIRTAFASGGSMTALDAAVSLDATDLTYPNQLVTSVDTQDSSRFLSVNNNTNLFDEATLFALTTQGIPSIYYGDEQYLHNDTTNSSGQVGGDPYDRPMMSSWNENTTNVTIIKDMSALRALNPALRYGSSTQRWLNSDVYIYERRFYNNVVLVAINKGGSSYDITGLNTALPAGTYTDVLGGALGGGSLTVSAGSNGNNPATAFTLGAGRAAVWSFVDGTASMPQVGNVGPTLGHAGDTIAVTGAHFGSTAGSVTVGGAAAAAQYWSDTEVDLTVPTGAAPGVDQVVVTNSAGTASNGIAYRVDSGNQVPVTFQVDNATTNPGDEIYLSGSVAELGNWSPSPSVAPGQLVCPDYPTWFTVASVPAGAAIQFKFVKVTSSGAVTWEGGANHTYTVPASGEGTVEVSWQN
jgi:glycosidase